MFPRKSSAYTASESKKAHKKALAKQRTQEALKRTGLPIKDFQIPPERFKKRLMSPKEEAVKAYSPAVTSHKYQYQIGNFLGKSLPKRETTMLTVESQTRKEEKEEARSPQKTSASPYLKTQTGARSDSPKFNFKKASSFKIPREQSKPLLNTNKERADEPSVLDIPVQEPDRREKSYDISDNKESKPNSKQSSRRSSTKAGLTGTPNNSGRSLPSAKNIQLKNALKKEMKTAFFDQRFKHNFFASSSENNSNATTKKNVEIQRGKKAIKQKGQKASSQGAKPATRSGERIRNWHMMDLQVPDIKVSVYESEGEKQDNHDKEDLSPQKNHIARSKDRNSSAYKLERQRSPVIGKHNERIPSSGMTTSGIGSWGINDVIIGREGLSIRSGSQKESHNNQSHDTKSQKSSKTSLKESAAKSKTNSTEKLTKSSIYSHMKGGKGSDASPELVTRESYSLKHDIYELLKSKDEKALKIFEAYEKRKETSKIFE